MIAKFAGLIALIALTFGAGPVRSEIVKEVDQAKNCTWYKRVSRVMNSAGEYVLERDLLPTEEIISKRSIYGFGLKDLEVDFDAREVRINIDQKIIMGRNLNLTSKKVTLSADHPKFINLINEINYDILLLDSVCVSSRNELIEAIRIEK